jgi:hypothetical protein
MIGLLASFLLAVPLLSGPDERPEVKDEALRHFQEEVAKYADLHARQLAKLGSRVPANAAQSALARAIEASRAMARPGDIFRPEVQPLFRRLIAKQLEGPEARRVVREGNPKYEPGSVQVAMRVNTIYPLGAPLSTVPPSLLLTLPPLPAPLQYRFVGRDLILLDSVAGLIVDFLSAAAPDLAVKK